MSLAIDLPELPNMRTLFDRVLSDIVARGIDGQDSPAMHEHVGKRLVEFIEQDLGDPLWEKQRAIANALDDHRFVAVKSCHAAGKSFTAARIVAAYLILHPHSIVVTTAPTNRQVRNILWRYINAIAARHGDRLPGRVLQMSWEIAPDWYAIGFKGSDDNSDAFQGFHAEHLLLVVDEAAGVSEQVFDAADAILTGEGASALLIGNPTSPSGTFRRAFHQDRALWHQISISAYDTPNFTTFGVTKDDMLSGAWQRKVADQQMPYPALIDPGWVARQIQRHGAESAFVTSRIDAEFPEDAGDTLISLAQIEAAQANAGELQPTGNYEVGIDVARFGDDETSIAIRRGPVLLAQESWGKLDTMESAGRCDHIMTRFGLDKDTTLVKVDATGIGSGVADRLRELGWNVRDVHNGAKSSDREQWRMLRDEMWWQLRERFAEGRIAPGDRGFDEITMAQLSDIKFKYLSGFTMPVIESKDEAKRRGVRSPDRAEAVVLAFAVLPDAEGAVPGVIMTRTTKGRW